MCPHPSRSQHARSIRWWDKRCCLVTITAWLSHEPSTHLQNLPLVCLGHSQIPLAAGKHSACNGTSTQIGANT
jgi:hypothetical protein